MAGGLPKGYPAVTPYLIVRDAARAIKFYSAVFGARERIRLPAPGGKIGHAELEFGESLIMLADEFPEHHAVAPVDKDEQSLTIHLYVPDVDAVVHAAEQAGARVRDPVTTRFYGDRLATLIDPFGHAWHVATRVEEVPEEELRRRAAERSAGG